MARKKKAKKSEASCSGIPEPAKALRAPAEQHRGRQERAAWVGFWVALALALVWVFGHAFVVDAVTVRFCNQADAAIPNPQDRLPLFLAPMAFDGYVWNRHAEYLGRNGELRLRKTDFDNAPHGREVHWNSAFAWYLRALGEIYRVFSGNSLRNSISRMSLWANPIILALTLVIFGTLAARRFGPLCGAVVLIGMITTPSFYEGFLPGYPDHHGLIAFALLGLTFGLAWAGGGWVRLADGVGIASPRSLQQARTGIILSAVSGAVGLWFSALSTAIALGAVGIGLLVATLVFSRSARAGGCQFHPELLRLWAIVGAGTSFLLYLVEYFPWHLSMRLEVNHPFYSLAWLGGGWGLAALCGWVAVAPKERPPFPWKSLLAAALACAPLPLAILLGGTAVYIPADPFMGRLWKNIAELLPLLLRIKLGTLTWQAALGFYPLLLLLGLIMLFLRRLHGGSKFVLLMMSVPILILTGLQFYQTRWGMLTGPLYIGLAGLVVPIFWRLVRGQGLATPVAATALAGYAILVSFPSFSGWILPIVRQFAAGERSQVDSQQALHILHRDMAKAIRANAAGRPVTLLSSPNSSCILGTIGDFRTIGTLYWENVDGLKAAALALNAQSDEEALQRIQKLGVTHVALMTWENFIAPYYYILYPKPVEGKSVENSFGIKALFQNRLPIWARPIPFPPHPFARALQQKILLLEIVPEQTPAEACYHIARFLRISGGQLDEAENFVRQSLEKEPSAQAQFELVAILAASGRNAEAVRNFKEAVPKASGPQIEQALSEIFPLITQSKKMEDALSIVQTAAQSPVATPNVLTDASWSLTVVSNPLLRNTRLAEEFFARIPANARQQPAVLAARAALDAARGDFESARRAALQSAEGFTRARQKSKAEQARAMADAYAQGQIWSP